MKRMLVVLCVSLICAAARSMADPPASLPITHVTLYTSGVGYFERSGTVDGDKSLPLSFPIDQVNDVLKSLVLLDENGGSIEPVTYAAIDPVAKQLRAFGVDLSDNPDRASLLNRLRGAPVTVILAAAPAPAGGSASPSSPESVQGIVVGVETQQEALPSPSGSSIPISELNVLAQDGLHTVPLDTIQSIRIDDPKLDAELREALQAVAQGRADNVRTVTLNFRGRGKRTVDVSYIAEAPLWQTTYRLLLGSKPLLQGWGLVQNTTQDDWDHVELSLVSGKPISFVQDLYTPIYVKRPTIASQVSQAVAPVSYGANVDAAPEAAAGVTSRFSKRPMAALMAPSPTEAPSPNQIIGVPEQNMLLVRGTSEGVAGMRDIINQSAAAAGARVGESLFRYDIPTGVTIPRQQSAMIPFISSPIQVQRVAIYNQGVNALHPLSGARITNTSGLHLMGGPITVFEDTGGGSYAGDALIDDTQPGQTRLISYALDVPVSVEVNSGDSSGRYLGFKIVKGVLTAMSRTEQATVYKIKNDGESDQTIVVEHPNAGAPWKLIEPVKPTEETPSVYRFDVAAPRGKSTSFTVRESMVNWQTTAVMDIDLDTIAVYMRDGAIAADVREALQGAVSRRQQLSAAQSALSGIQQLIDQISAGQERIRSNMKVLSQSSALYKRYSEELNSQEDKLADLSAKRDAEQDTVNRLQASLADYLNNLTVGTLPGQ